MKNPAPISAFRAVFKAMAARKRAVSVLLYGVLSVLPSITAGLLAILYTSAFAPSEYGSYGICAAIIALLGVIMDMGFAPAILRNYFGNRAKPETYLSSIIPGAQIVMCVLFIPAVAGLFLTWNVFGSGIPLSWSYPAIIALIVLLDRCGDILATALRAAERPGFFFVGRVVQSTVLLCAGFLFVFELRLGVMGALLAMLAGEITQLLAYEIILFRALRVSKGRVNWSDVRACFVFGLPLVPNRVASLGRQSVLRPILAHYVPLSAVGLYSFASSVAIIPTLVSTTVDFALSPIYFKRRHDTDSAEFRQKVREFGKIFIVILLPLWAIAILFCNEAIYAVAGEKYAGAGPICAVLLCASFMRIQQGFLIRQIHFLRDTWVLPLINIPGSALCVGLAIVLAQLEGIQTACWAVAIADFLILGAMIWYLRRHDGVDYPLVMSFAFIATLVALALWLNQGKVFAGPFAIFSLKVGIAVALTGICYFGWVRPQLAFISKIIKS